MDLNTLMERPTSQKVPGAVNWKPSVGDTVGGLVVADAVTFQAMEMDGKTLKWWDKDQTEPMWKVAVTVHDPAQTGPDNPEGLWTVYIQWWTHQQAALRDALTEAQATEIKEGGKFSATLIRTEPSGRGNPSNIFVYQYEKPPSAMSKLVTGNGSVGSAAQPSQPALPIEPASQPSVATAQPAVNGAAGQADLGAQFTQIRAMLAAGLDPATIGQVLPAVPMAVIQAVAAAPAT